MDIAPGIKPPSIFTLSIEPCDGPVYLYGFHLGTDPTIAREHARGVFSMVNNRKGCYTVALIRDGKLYDTWDGRDWHSAIVNKMYDGLIMEQQESKK